MIAATAVPMRSSLRVLWHGLLLRCTRCVILILGVQVALCHPVGGIRRGGGMMTAASLIRMIPMVQAVAAAAPICPASPAWVHARCQMTITFEQSCKQVKQELLARIKSKHWVDPHNRGTYRLDEMKKGTATTATSANSSRPNRHSSKALLVSRQSGEEDSFVTDKMAFDFITPPHDRATGTGGRREPGCVVKACSTSQSWSILDQFTNYCNLHNLYCNSNNTMTSTTMTTPTRTNTTHRYQNPTTQAHASCFPIKYDLTYTEQYEDCWQRNVQRCHTTRATKEWRLEKVLV